MEIFNAPTRETCTVRRERTDTPLQALVLLNDPTYLEAARALAQRGFTAEARAAALFLHGNAGNVTHRDAAMKDLAAAGISGPALCSPRPRSPQYSPPPASQPSPRP